MESEETVEDGERLIGGETVVVGVYSKIQENLEMFTVVLFRY